MDAYGTLRVAATHNGVKVYNVSGGKSVPQWLSEKKRRALQKDESYLRRIELIQDLAFDTAATKIKATPDNNFLVVSGVYPPQVRVYEFSQLSMKFERHLDSEIVDFQILGDDYSKLAFLCADRTLQFHARFGAYYKTRIPKFGRGLAYDRSSCDLLAAASSPEVYRLNLEQGRFLSPLLTRSPAINVIGRSPVHGLIACGGEDGALECFDLRTRQAVGRIDAAGPAGGSQQVTALRFEDQDGLAMAVGTSGGQVLLYDLRSSKPVQMKDHLYGCPIVDIKYHSAVSTAQRHIISTDTKIVKIWDPATGANLSSIEPPSGDINDMCVLKDSGLIMLALDAPRLQNYFIPALGPAPRWCSFLDNLTEELEEEAGGGVYEDYKFVTQEDLQRLGIANLLGTNLLRAYMHGFFIDHRLYNKAKNLADPFAYDRYREERVQAKMDAERAARITVKRRLPRVNKEMAARLLLDQDAAAPAAASSEEDAPEDPAAGRPQKKHKGLPNLLQDDRFAAMFKDKAFAIDPASDEYKALHPNAPERHAKERTLLEEHFADVDSEEEGAEDDQEQAGPSDSDLDSGSDRGKRKREPQGPAKKQARKKEGPR